MVFLDAILHIARDVVFTIAAVSVLSLITENVEVRLSRRGIQLNDTAKSIFIVLGAGTIGILFYLVCSLLG